MTLGRIAVGLVVYGRYHAEDAMPVRPEDPRSSRRIELLQGSSLGMAGVACLCRLTDHLPYLRLIGGEHDLAFLVEDPHLLYLPLAAHGFDGVMDRFTVVVEHVEPEASRQRAAQLSRTEDNVIEEVPSLGSEIVIGGDAYDYDEGNADPDRESEG